MEAQFEMLSEMAKNGDKLNFGQDFFVKFYQAFLYSDRWQQYFKGVGTTLLVTAIALVLGVVLGAIVAMIRVGYAQQKPHHRNPILGVLNAVCQVYVTVIRGTPMMVQLLIMSMVIFASSRNFTMVGGHQLRCLCFGDHPRRSDGGGPRPDGSRAQPGPELYDHDV